MKKLMTLVIVLSTLISCGPSESEIQQRIDSAVKEVVQQTVEAETPEYQRIFNKFIGPLAESRMHEQLLLEMWIGAQVKYFMVEPLSNRFGSTELSEILISGPNELKMSPENRIKEEQYFYNWLNEWFSNYQEIETKSKSETLTFRNNAVKFKNQSFSTNNLVEGLTPDIQFQRIVFLNTQMEGFEKRTATLVSIFGGWKCCGGHQNDLLWNIGYDSMIEFLSIRTPLEVFELAVK